MPRCSNHQHRPPFISRAVPKHRNTAPSLSNQTSQPQTHNMSNPGNVIGGHKANLNNPNTSDEAKQHSKQVIDEHMQSGEMPQADQHKNPGNVYVLNNFTISHSSFTMVLGSDADVLICGIVPEV